MRMTTPGLDYRPCGACGELVPADAGCPHWRPGLAQPKRTGWAKGPARSTASSPTTPRTACDCGKPPTSRQPHTPGCALLAPIAFLVGDTVQ